MSCPYCGGPGSAALCVTGCKRQKRHNNSSNISFTHSDDFKRDTVSERRVGMAKRSRSGFACFFKSKRVWLFVILAVIFTYGSRQDMDSFWDKQENCAVNAAEYKQIVDKVAKKDFGEIETKYIWCKKFKLGGVLYLERTGCLESASLAQLAEVLSKKNNNPEDSGDSDLPAHLLINPAFRNNPANPMNPIRRGQ